MGLFDLFKKKKDGLESENISDSSKNDVAKNVNVYYLKQKIMPGAGADHSKVLVLIYPPAQKR